MIRIMFNVDGILLIAFAAAILIIVQRDYVHSNVTLRAVLYAVSFFAFCCAMHAFGIMKQSWAVAYWARVALDACLAAAGFMRVFYGRFFPAARRAADGRFTAPFA